MKSTSLLQKAVIVSVISLAALFSSCGVNTALILNHNQNNTQVQLAGTNYKVLNKVSGTSEVTYICAIGGLCKSQLYQNAYSDMMDKANLIGGSKAMINVITEEHVKMITPFYIKRTITVSGYVIEFTK